jgi:cytochrome b involved in lipid metabolism
MSRVISMSEVSKHTTQKDGVWFVIHGDVYDVTNFLKEHPGGSDILIEVAGGDATEAFEDVGHPKKVKEQLKKYRIGTLGN